MQMKKLFPLLSLVMIIFLNGCQKDIVTCKITSPYNGKSILVGIDLGVTIEATSTKSSVSKVIVTFDEISYSSYFTAFELVTPPYTITLSSQLLTLGKHTIKAVATTDGGTQAESSVTFNVVESIDNEKESPDFVTFSGIQFPEGWITYTWEPANIGFDDNYSIQSANYPFATVYANKTFNAKGYVQFYTKGGDVDLYIDEVKAQVLISELGNWNKWICPVDSGKHTFKWQAEGVRKYLDAITFTLDLKN